MDLDYYMSLPYRVEIIKDTDEEGYVAFIPELKGCITTGLTEEDALENLKDAKAAWLLSALEDGDPIPEPTVEMSNSGRTYRRIDFPPLTDAQKKELEALGNMKEEDINTEDIPEVDFSDAALRYVGAEEKTTSGL